MPAVVEASMSRTRLVLLTADRPPELRGVGANQTIDQPAIFGSYVRASIDAPVAGDVEDPSAWDELVREAVGRRALGPPLGPVHVNLPFREPLVPSAIPEPPASPARAFGSAIVQPPPEDVELLLDEIASDERGLFVAGSVTDGVGPLADLAARAGWPSLAEPGSGARARGALAAGVHLLMNEAFLEGHVPDVIVQVGPAPTSRAVLEMVRRAGRLVIVDPDRVVGDPHRRASRTFDGSAGPLLSAVLDALEPRETRWWRAWRDADAVARAAIDAELDADDEPFEGRVARDVAAHLADGSALVVGSSMPVRDLDAYMAPRDGLRVIANRGASGIDGFVSTALGVAATRPSTVAHCGDLTFLYDAGSFVWSASRGIDLVLVVLNNRGGRIFSLLPQRELPELEELFVTPHGIDLALLCGAARAGHTRVSRSSDLVPAIDAASDAGGVQVVEVMLDPAHQVDTRERVQTVVAEALGRR
jgi:2-succinyl-5-enolpyruvyl-6-hydroxy-3-cyclohexene-1-carboxylate synthase